ncbi:MAG: TOBE domain-containing protein, partial [Phycisphaerales bacterium]
SVFVTHDQDEALELSDRVVVMNHGRIEQIGTPDEIFHNPQTEFVMNFLGQVNVFHGRVDRGKVSFEQISLEAPEQADAPSGSKARVFIRPHDVTIDTKPNGMPAIPATVLRVHSAGSIVQVQLRTDAGQTLLAELSQDRFKTMTLDPGTSVYVRPRHIRVFSELTDPVV